MATGLEGGGCLNDPRLPTKRDSLYGFRQAHASWGKEKVSKIRYVLIFQPGFRLTECSREPQNDSREFYDLVGGCKMWEADVYIQHRDLSSVLCHYVEA